MERAKTEWWDWHGEDADTNDRKDGHRRPQGQKRKHRQLQETAAAIAGPTVTVQNGD